MEIKVIAENTKNGLNKADNIIECNEVNITDNETIYISFTESVDAHGLTTQDLIRLDIKFGCSVEEYILNKAEEYVKWLLQVMGVSAEVELDFESVGTSNECIWVYGDIVIK